MNLKPLLQFSFMVLSALTLSAASFAFLKEVTATQRCLVLIPLESPENTFVTRATSLLLGRSSECEIQILHPSVSHQHCRIYWKKGEFHVVDLDSRNGTFINNERISHAVLKDGDTLQLGAFALKVKIR